MEAKIPVNIDWTSRIDGTAVSRTAQGELFEKAGSVYIRYAETAADEGVVRTTMKLARDGCLRIMRRGAIHSDLIFAPGAATTGSIGFAGGALPLSIRTRHLAAALGNGSGSIRLSYELYQEERLLGSFDVSFHIEER